MSEAHTRLLAQVFEHLTGSTEKLPSAWVDEQVGRFDRTDGDIDTLAARIANVRTWTYITNRGDWVDDPLDRQQRARGIEDRLSDALHDRQNRSASCRARVCQYVYTSGVAVSLQKNKN